MARGDSALTATGKMVSPHHGLRVDLSRESLQVLQIQRARPWHDIVTLDGSSFYFSMDDEWIGLSPGERVPGRDRYVS
jgi:hypothetical protein